MVRKAVKIRSGILGARPPKSHSSFADDKAHRDLIPQMQASHLFENKIICLHDFTDHCILSSANDIQRETKVKRQKLDSITIFKYLGAVFI